MESFEDDVETRRIQRLQWLPPVQDPAELPSEGVEVGTLCFVEGPGDGTVWERLEEGWVCIG